MVVFEVSKSNITITALSSKDREHLMAISTLTNQWLSWSFEYMPLRVDWFQTLVDLLLYDIPDHLFIAFTSEFLSGSLEARVYHNMYSLKSKQRETVLTRNMTALVVCWNTSNYLYVYGEYLVNLPDT